MMFMFVSIETYRWTLALWIIIYEQNVVYKFNLYSDDLAGKRFQNSAQSSINSV
jgi:hypothetical protein